MELQIIHKKIFEIRGARVMLDFHLAGLYDVETRALKQAVRRNRRRFPPDYMFQLSDREVGQMVSQNVIPSKRHFGGAIPFAFTEQGHAVHGIEKPQSHPGEYFHHARRSEQPPIHGERSRTMNRLNHE